MSPKLHLTYVIGIKDRLIDGLRKGKGTFTLTKTEHLTIHPRGLKLEDLHYDSFTKLYYSPSTTFEIEVKIKFIRDKSNRTKRR